MLPGIAKHLIWVSNYTHQSDLYLNNPVTGWNAKWGYSPGIEYEKQAHWKTIFLVMKNPKMLKNTLCRRI